MGFKLVILGNNSAIPTANRHPAAHLLNANERFFLIDCGEGTQMRLRKQKIKFQRISHIFITHLHGDHYFGLIGLLTTLHLLGREKEMHIFSPPGLKLIIDTQMKVSNTRLAYQLHFNELDADKNTVILEDDYLSVETIPLDHRIACCGYLFREKPKPRKINAKAIKDHKVPLSEIQHLKLGVDFITSTGQVISNSELTEDPDPPVAYAHCSDTAFNERIVSLVANVALLFHEATFLEDQAKRAKKTNHSTARQAASIAKLANVSQLIIGHFSSRYKDIEPFLEEAKSIFPNTVLAEEGNTYSIG